jgi:hypothetical protein
LWTFTDLNATLEAEVAFVFGTSINNTQFTPEEATSKIIL